MKIKKVPFFAIFLVIVASLLVGSCSTAKKVRKADQTFAEYKYDKARRMYSNVASKVKDKNEKERLRWQIAECYRYKDDLSNSQQAYSTLISNKYYEKQPLVYYHLGNCYLKTNRLDRAEVNFKKYVDLAPDDTLGILALERVVLAREYEIEPGEFDISEEKKFNSNWDDFCPIYSNSAYNEVIFTSNRGTATGKGKDEWTGNKFSDLFVVRKNLKGVWGTPTLLEENEVINTPLNEGAAAMNGRFTTLYFTRCEKPDDRAGGCAIFRSKRQGMVWTEPQRIDLVSDSSAVIGHPTVTPDETLLIVAAELPGGYGKKDLWYAKESGGKYGELQNLGGIINTVGDEMFPHLRGDSVLYFSSDFHPGMGGLDIFRSTITWDEAGNPTFSEPVNLRYPVNSIGDDFGICFHPEGNTEGYFSSRRKTNSGANIYSFIVEPVIFTISGIIRDANTLLYVPDVTITLFGSDSTDVQILSGENGTFLFNKAQVKKGVDYVVVIEKEGYFSREEKISTNNIDVSRNFKIDVMDFLAVPKEPVVLPEILYDYGKSDLKPQYQDSLRGLIRILEANPTITIELAAHTDSRGSDEANRELSQKRAQAVVDYLIDRGIDADRLTAKGYGESAPRVIQKEMTRDGFTFNAGTKLNDEYIATLLNRVEQEAAHQLNRRIEFSIVSTRYVPKQNKEYNKPAVSVTTYDESRGVPIIELIGKKEMPKMACFVNGMSEMVVLDEAERVAVISLSQAMDFLRNGYITKDDFEGNPEKVLAGGTIAKNSKFIIGQLRIADKSVYDVTVEVDPNYKFPLTIPAFVMEEMGDYVIDKEKKMVFFK